MPKLGRLKTRPEFLRVAAARRKAVRPGLIVQARRRDDEDRTAVGRDDRIRFGLTASRKVGGAVRRNRARRRLRAAAEAVLSDCGEAGTDYVLIARAATVERSFPDLIGDLETALAEVHKRRPRSKRGTGRKTASQVTNGGNEREEQA
jgi:ribonuclease P protein component